MGADCGGVVSRFSTNQVGVPSVLRSGDSGVEETSGLYVARTDVALGVSVPELALLAYDLQKLMLQVLFHVV